MIAALMRWLFGALGLHDYVLQQALSGFGNGGAKTVVRLQLGPVVVVRGLIDLFTSFYFPLSFLYYNY
jgi:hypothetical protein